jgi:hypothetical protein
VNENGTSELPESSESTPRGLWDLLSEKANASADRKRALRRAAESSSSRSSRPSAVSNCPARRATSSSMGSARRGQPPRPTERPPRGAPTREPPPPPASNKSSTSPEQRKSPRAAPGACPWRADAHARTGRLGHPKPRSGASHQACTGCRVERLSRPARPTDKCASFGLAPEWAVRRRPPSRRGLDALRGSMSS